MKTQEVLNKYKTIIAGILKCEVEDVKFFIDERGHTIEERKVIDEIGNFVYNKSYNWSLGRYHLKVNGITVSTWRLYEMQHCCAFMISCNVNVNPTFRNKKIGTILNQLRQDIGRLLGYTAILCTDIETNVHQRKLLKTNGWKDIHSVVNKRTKNLVHLSVINI